MRIMVDMSCTLIHHGHIRLIKKASKYGDVVIGLTTDDEILNAFGYKDKQAEELKVKLAGKIPPKAAPKKNVYDDVDEDFNKRFRRR